MDRVARFCVPLYAVIGDRRLMASLGSRRRRLCTQRILGQSLCMVF